jgi:rSAM/selenodomain-associated transferase 1
MKSMTLRPPAISNLAATCAMAVMAKAPQAGRSKTRLVPPLSPEQAATLSAAFLRDITENIEAANRSIPIAGSLAYAPAGAEALFDGLIAPGTALHLADGRLPEDMPMPQGVAGFGRCLFHAVSTLLGQGFGAAALINSDSPTLPTEFLVRTAALLAAPGERAVLGPATDGGYYLIGLKTPHSHLFADIDWSTPRVAKQTRQRAREIGIAVVELPEWYDVDDAASLARLEEELAEPGTAPVPYAAPATTAWMRRWKLGALAGNLS